jgi:hypothetical protein
MLVSIMVGRVEQSDPSKRLDIPVRNKLHPHQEVARRRPGQIPDFKELLDQAIKSENSKIS